MKKLETKASKHLYYLFLLKTNAKVQEPKKVERTGKLWQILAKLRAIAVGKQNVSDYVLAALSKFTFLVWSYNKDLIDRA